MIEVMIEEAMTYISEAQARGGRVLCGKCRQPASFAIACETGEFQGVACAACFAVHREFIESAMIFQASGLVDTPICSRCGMDGPSAQHLTTKEL